MYIIGFVNQSRDDVIRLDMNMNIYRQNLVMCLYIPDDTGKKKRREREKKKKERKRERHQHRIKMISALYPHPHPHPHHITSSGAHSKAANGITDPTQHQTKTP